MKKFLLLALLVLLSGTVLAQDIEAATINAADTAWILVSTSFVFFMVVGLAFFYGGLVRQKNALNTMMMSFIALGVVGITWALVGYSFAYDSSVGGIVGGFGYFLMNNIGTDGDGIPAILDFAFQGTFAIITAALISGAVVERMRFAAYMGVIALWSIFIYAPMTHWVWGDGVLFSLLGRDALDFAGGTVVHINAAIAALVLAFMLGRRKDFGKQAMLPHQVPFTLLGAGILWFGWFGFNGGSAYGANGIAALAMTNTLLAPAATMVIWATLDYFRTSKFTAVGTATAIVVGLVAITPAAGFVSPLSAIIIGIIAAFPSYFFINWRANSGLDDSLDVFGAHGLGGIVGALLTGIFASTAWNPDGADASVAQFMTQLLAIVIAIAYSAIGTFVIAKVVSLVWPLRADDKSEAQGLDIPSHGEEAYSDGEGALLIPVSSSKTAAAVTAGVAGKV